MFYRQTQELHDPDTVHAEIGLYWKSLPATVDRKQRLNLTHDFELQKDASS